MVMSQDFNTDICGKYVDVICVNRYYAWYESKFLYCLVSVYVCMCIVCAHAC